MGGTVLIALSTYAGINTNGEHLSLSPALPEAWNHISCKIIFRGTAYALFIGNKCIKICASKNTDVFVNNQKISLLADIETVIN